MKIKLKHPIFAQQGMFALQDILEEHWKLLIKISKGSLHLFADHFVLNQSLYSTND